MRAEPRGQLRRPGERQRDAEVVPLSRATRGNVAVSLALRLYQGGRRAGERELEDAGAAIVRDATHDVESSRRAGDVQRPVGREELPHARIGIVRQTTQPIERRLKPVHFK